MHVYSENVPYLTDLHHFLTKQCRLLTLIRHHFFLLAVNAALVYTSMFMLLKISDYKRYSLLLIKNVICLIAANHSFSYGLKHVVKKICVKLFV